MSFDYALGKEATFNDWVADGCRRAEELLDSIREPETVQDEKK